MSIGEAVGTALIQEVDVFDEQAEEGNDDLEGTGGRSALVSSHLPWGLQMLLRAQLANLSLGLGAARGIGYLVCMMGAVWKPEKGGTGLLSLGPDCFFPAPVRLQC